MTDLPSLVVPIIGDLSGLNKAFTQVTANAKKFAGEIGKKMEPLRVGLNNVGSAALRVVAPIAAAATAFAGFAAIVSAFERNEALGKMSAALGIAVDELSKLHYVAKLNMGSAEGMNAALMKMEKFLGDAAAGGEEANAKLRMMGLSLRDLAGLKPEEAFGKLADGMNSVENQGQKMDLMLSVFGKNSKEIAGTVRLGAQGIKDMGTEGERLGRTMSAVDFGKLDTAKGAIEKMAGAFESLSNRISIALAPVFNWIATAIDEWIGNTEDFDAVFKGVAKAIVVSIGVIRTVWAGLELMWEGAKVVVGELSVAFMKTADNIIYAIKWIGDKAGKTWAWIGASFNATKEGLVFAWRWISDQVIDILSGIGIAFGRQMQDMGLAMSRSGVKGMIEAGSKLADAGGSLIVGAVQLRSGSAELLKSARDDLDASVSALEGARADLTKPTELSTGMENLVANAQRFRDEAVQAFDDVAYKIASMKGGNPFADTLASAAASIIAFNQAAAKATEEGLKEREVITAAFRAESEGTEAEYYDRRGQMLAEHFGRVLKSTQDAQDELDFMQVDNQAMQSARQDEFNAQRELDERKAVDAQVMLWESGAMGKMAAIGGVLNNLASLMQSKNKTLFMIGKVAAMAQNVIDTIRSAASSYAFGAEIGGPVVGGAFAATAVLAGLVRAQQLMAAQPTGGTIGGGVGGGGATSSGADVAKQQAASAEQRNVNVTLYGDSFSGSQVRGLIGAINEQVGDNMSLKAQVGK
jgi:hypothetical protein